MTKVVLLLFLCFASGKSLPRAAGNGFFWQVSDFHYDSNYSATGNPTSMCHTDNNGSTFQAGTYGNYLCDAPWVLVKSAVEAMKAVEGNPDFIIWTGDSVPHVPESDIDLHKVYQLIGNVTEELLQVFPNTSIYPVLGNHDPYPSNMMPYDVDQTDYYTGILNQSKWDLLLDEEQQNQFKKGGYFSIQRGNSLRIIGLNTNLYYSMDKLTKDVDDPALQFKWLDRQLREAANMSQSVYLVAHVPPGMFEVLPNFPWFYENFNKRFLEIVRKHKDVIKAQMYGHEHTDSFRVLFSDTDRSVISQMFLSPAVTPWKSTLAGVEANNPSIRLYEYNRDDHSIIRYQQFFLNLTAANSPAGPRWEMEYDTSVDYALDKLSPTDWHMLIKDFHVTENGMFKKYLTYNTVSYVTDPVCNHTCYMQHYCAIANLDFYAYGLCLNGEGPTTTRPKSTHPHPHHTTKKHHHKRKIHTFPNFMYIIIGVLAGTILIVFVIVSVLCLHKRKRVIPRGYSKFGSLAIN